MFDPLIVSRSDTSRDLRACDAEACQAGLCWDDEHRAAAARSSLGLEAGEGRSLSDVLRSLEEELGRDGGMDALDEVQLLEVVDAFARIEAFGAAGTRAAAAALAARAPLADRCVQVPDKVEVQGLAADEVAARLGVSRRRAGRLIGEGQAFGGVLYLVGEALLDGEVDAAKSGLFAEKLADQPETVALAVCGSCSRMHPRSTTTLSGRRSTERSSPWIRRVLTRAVWPRRHSGE
ncbi:hypothetical protein [Salana multivorans]